MTEFKVGDEVWTHLPGEKGYWRATIVAALKFESITHKIFVLQMHRRDWLSLECRDATLLSAKEGELPTLVRK